MRGMTTLFHDMIHKEIKVYVDNVVIKSKRSSDHLDALQKFFERLQKYNLKLNLAKCAFGVPTGKLLGFIVSRKGIEFDPSKIKTIHELPPPKDQEGRDEILGKTKLHQSVDSSIHSHMLTHIQISEERCHHEMDRGMQKGI